MTPAVMIAGTGSDAGKSLVVAGLARAFARRGIKVRPFKAQNMSNNAAVSATGAEIARAQALQARAAGVTPTADMNPVLLKPEGDGHAQLVIAGAVKGRVRPRQWRAIRDELLAAATAAFARVSADAELMLAEGAGSVAEVNLRESDVANFGFAEAANVPMILVTDVERGGAIAALVGTHALLSPADRSRIKGFIINKFRGDVSLFAPAVKEIEERTGWTCFGILPYVSAAERLPAEDSLALSRSTPATTPHRGDRILVAVPRLPRLANFDDLDPLLAEPELAVEMIPPGRPIPAAAALVVLAGSKATLSDLEALKAEGWDVDIHAHVRRGGRVIGVCGGYQMLGKTVADPDGIEGKAGSTDGLGLLDVETVMGRDKTLGETRGRAVALAGTPPVTGYEIHLGRTSGPGLGRPMLELAAGPDGAVSADGRVMGCYLHGLFSSDAFRAELLKSLGGQSHVSDYERSVDTALDELADACERHLALDRVLEVAGGR
ncbi:MAG TPA: cobyric acid synthase [Alphaproteobacteria bacterium]|jgi:adenosylcobyric acid synthase|nr:cobyric acid synthase [Alphaproteobacteria bacterium]